MSDLPDLHPGTEAAIAFAMAGGPDAHRVGNETVETPEGPIRVSTILDYMSFLDTSTAPYETALFAGEEMLDSLVNTYLTREEAEAGHTALVAKLEGQDKELLAGIRAYLAALRDEETS